MRLHTVAGRTSGFGPGRGRRRATVDYLTTIAVSVTAGTAAIVAFAPAEHASGRLRRGLIVLLILVNLRGVRDAGAAFVLLAYLFVGSPERC